MEIYVYLEESNIGGVVVGSRPHGGFFAGEADPVITSIWAGVEVRADSASKCF